MRNRERYGKDWPKKARATKERAGWQCEECGVVHGTKQISQWTGNEWPTWLQAAHLNHDPENEDAELVAVCPKCHWHFYRKPGRAAWVAREKRIHRRLIDIAFLQ